MFRYFCKTEMKRWYLWRKIKKNQLFLPQTSVSSEHAFCIMFALLTICTCGTKVLCAEHMKSYTKFTQQLKKPVDFIWCPEKKPVQSAVSSQYACKAFCSKNTSGLGHMDKINTRQQSHKAINSTVEAFLCDQNCFFSNTDCATCSYVVAVLKSAI